MLLLFVSTGCSGQATVVLRDGRVVRGKIEGRRDGALILDNGAPDRIGRSTREREGPIDCGYDDAWAYCFSPQALEDSGFERAWNDSLSAEGRDNGAIERAWNSRSFQTASNGSNPAHMTIAEQSIREIRHPGKAAMIAGGALLGLGLVFLAAAGATDCSAPSRAQCPTQSSTGNDGYCFDFSGIGCDMSVVMFEVMGGTIAAAGLGVGIYGASVYSSSKAASEPHQTRSEADLPPIVTTRGVRLSGRF